MKGRKEKKKKKQKKGIWRPGHLPVLTWIPFCKIVLVKYKIQKSGQQGRELNGVLKIHLDFLKKKDGASLKNKVAGRVAGALQSRGADRVPTQNGERHRSFLQHSHSQE